MSKTVPGVIAVCLFRVILFVFLSLVSESTADHKKLRKYCNRSQHIPCFSD